MTKTTLLLIRHGETRMNVQNIFRGRTDISLNENGVRQAGLLAAALAELPVRAVYSSPLSRARETAQPLAERLGLPVIPMDEFHNISLGDWEGRSKEDIRTGYPELWEQWIHSPETMIIPGGETLVQVRARARRGIESLLQRHLGEMAAVITHRSVLKAALATILNLERDYFWKFYLDNCSYSVVEHTPLVGFTIRRLNENCHLEQAVEETF